MANKANIFETSKKKKVADNERENCPKIQDFRVERIAVMGPRCLLEIYSPAPLHLCRQCMCTAGYESDARKYRESRAIPAGLLSRRTRDNFLAIIYTCDPALGNKNNFFSNVCASSRRRTCPRRIFPPGAAGARQGSSPRVQLRF